MGRFTACVSRDPLVVFSNQTPPPQGCGPLHTRDVHGRRQQASAQHRSGRKHPPRGAFAGCDGYGWGCSHATGSSSDGSTRFPHDGWRHAHGTHGTDDAWADWWYGRLSDADASTTRYVFRGCFSSHELYSKHPRKPLVTPLGTLDAGKNLNKSKEKIC